MAARGRMIPVVALAVIALASACARTPPIGAVRFANAPPVTRVNDRLDVPRPPHERPFYRGFYHVDSFYLEGKRGLRLERTPRARGVNALDEVPDSTWFTNRIGIRDVSPDEIRTGAAPRGSPELHFPWTITSSKTGGTSIGLRAEDARGVRFLLKFDPPHAPEVESGADAIVARLLWACGFNVPEDHVVYFRPTELRLAPGAMTQNRVGEDIPLTAQRLGALLAPRPRTADGRIRGLASILIEGTSIGGTPRLGVRPDDRNDRIPHELRRDLRGQRAIFAWLDHTDIKEDNTLDVWRADPADPSIHYVVHYLLDFDNALGAQAKVRRRYSEGYEYIVAPRELLTSILTAGLWPRRWEGRRDPQVPGVGLLESAPYDPAEWRPHTFAHFPLLFADRFDQFWGAKILIRFTRAQLAAAVEAGRYTDPRAAAYVLDTLIARQRSTARHWFRQVAPLDAVTIAEAGSGAVLCFTDLALLHGLETQPTTYRVTSHAETGGALAQPTRRVRASPAGSVCIADLALASAPASYTILRVAGSRGSPEARLPATLVHVARAPDTGALRVIGIERR